MALTIGALGGVLGFAAAGGSYVYAWLQADSVHHAEEFPCALDTLRWQVDRSIADLE